MIEQREVTFDLAKIMQGAWNHILVPHFWEDQLIFQLSLIASRRAARSLPLSHRCPQTHEMFVSHYLLNVVSEMQDPDSGMLQKEVDLSDLLDPKGTVYL